MIRYFQRVPAAAVRVEIDGHRYVNVTAQFRRTLSPTFEVVEGEWHTLRFGPESFIKNGEAYVYIGAMGDAIAPTMNLPFSVTAVKGEDL